MAFGKARRKVEPTARHYEQAVETVQSWYPADIFGEGKDPISRQPERVRDMIAAKAARMARLTCDHIRRHAQELAEAEANEDGN